MSAPASGANGTVSSSPWDIVVAIAALAFQLVEFIDLDRSPIAEQHDQDRQADGRLGRRHGEDEEDEDLAGHVAQVVREGDEVQVHGEQHQLDRHQQHDQVAPVQAAERSAAYTASGSPPKACSRLKANWKTCSTFMTVVFVTSPWLTPKVII